MKRSLTAVIATTIVALSTSLALAQTTNAQIDLEKIELLLTTPAQQQPTAQYPVPSRTLLLGVRNLGPDPILSSHLNAELFEKGDLCGEEPDGTTQRLHISELTSRKTDAGRSRPPQGIVRGQVYVYQFLQKPITELFGHMNKEGTYLVWWEIGRKRSNYLAFERDSGTLTKER